MNVTKIRHLLESDFDINIQQIGEGLVFKSTREIRISSSASPSKVANDNAEKTGLSNLLHSDISTQSLRVTVEFVYRLLIHVFL